MWQIQKFPIRDIFKYILFCVVGDKYNSQNNKWTFNKKMSWNRKDNVSHAKAHTQKQIVDMFCLHSNLNVKKNKYSEC